MEQDGADPLEGDVALRYMDRFGCIGPNCEDTCCHTWVVHVDDKTYEWLDLATKGHPEDRAAVKAAFKRSKRDKKKVKLAEFAARKGLPAPIDEHAYYIKHGSDGFCTLYKGGICTLHAKFGPRALPNVCAIYPRRLNIIGERYELTGTISCPEVSRQLLLHEDGADIVPWDRGRLPRPMFAARKDPRDVRPYWRLHVPVRQFVMELLGDPTWPLASRLLFLTWFANRTSAVLNTTTVAAEEEHVRREMEHLKNPAVLRALDERFAKLETPSALVLLLARGLMGAVSTRGVRDTFVQLTRRIFETYLELEALLPEDGVEGRRSEELTERVYAEYRRRRDLVLERAGARCEQYFRNFAIHWWFHRMHFESRDVLVHALRCQAEMALQRFMLFSHPEVYRVLQAGGPEAEGAALIEVLDKAAVEVFYNVGRSIEHSPIMTKLEEALEKRGLKSVAGSVFLARF
jgi:lysine-N-methylase